MQAALILSLHIMGCVVKMKYWCLIKAILKTFCYLKKNVVAKVIGKEYKALRMIKLHNKGVALATC